MSTTSLPAPSASRRALSRGTLGPAQRAALAAVRAYQLLVSPWLGQHCRFTPSCSAYAAEAVRRHGALAGAWYALRRLVRCHPFGASGHDPVP